MDPKELRSFLIMLSHQLSLLHTDMEKMSYMSQKQSANTPQALAAYSNVIEKCQNSIDAKENIISVIQDIVHFNDGSRL